MRLRKVATDPLIGKNPVTVETLGICSALAVTMQVQTALVMGLAMVFVSALSSLTVSMLRKTIPHQIRLVIQLCIIATLVILADLFIKAFFFEMSRQLTVYVGLIITNCIILGRTESFAMHNAPLPSLLDGIGNGLGYGAVLLIVSSIREIIGQGSWCGLNVLPGGYQPNLLFLLPAGAFIVMGLLVWLQNSLMNWRKKNENN